MPSTPALSRIIALVRLAGPKGTTAEAVARITGGTTQAVKAALRLQMQADVMSTEELFDGERYVGTIYRMREGG